MRAGTKWCLLRNLKTFVSYNSKPGKYTDTSSTKLSFEMIQVLPLKLACSNMFAAIVIGLSMFLFLFGGLKKNGY
jgi:hypothetical protein